MDIDDEDDFYAPEEPQTTAQPAPTEAPATKKDASEELESGEEEDEGGAMDEDEDSVGALNEIGFLGSTSTDHDSRISISSQSGKTPQTHPLHRELDSSHHHK
jgi:pre-mRNA 3'-end-processing factor FIP1